MNKKLTQQIVVITILLALPVVMIYFNGARAVNGIKWNEEQSVISDKPAEKLPKYNYISFGVYDPQNELKSIGWDVIHIYLSWVDFDLTQTRNKLNEIVKSGKRPMITIEPWTKDEDPLLEEIVNGNYDKEMNKLIELVDGIADTILVSWGHEMDQDLSTRYPWSAKKTDAYISAYRYVHEYLQRDLNTHIKWIWAPVGKRHCSNYWPGDQYVDFIGLPIYSYPDWDKSYYGYIRDFQTVFKEKTQSVSSLDKPIYIVEYGVTGSADYQAFWMHQTFRAFSNCQRLKGVIFYYSMDVERVWGESLSTPNWKSNKEVVHSLVDWYKSQFSTNKN